MPMKTGTVQRTAPPSYDEEPLMRWWLDWHRDALLLSCEGLSDDQLRQRAVPPSNLSLLGLVRHLTVLERIYWRRIFLGDDSVDALWCEEDPEGDIDGVEDADVPACFEHWQAERRHADELLNVRSFDDVGAGGQTVRFWVLKLINEYARHNGHADLIRESLDGTIGE